MGPIVGAIDFHAFGQLILRPWGKCIESNTDFLCIHI